MENVMPPILAFGTELTITSNEVARRFNRRYIDVVRAIENIITPYEGITEAEKQFYSCNFARAECVNRKGEISAMYEMTYNGFLFLAMGFTGNDARRVKIAFLNAVSKGGV